MSGFDVLSPAQQAQIVQQYGSLAAARAAMEAPAPPPMGAPVAPPPAPVVAAPPPPPAPVAPAPPPPRKPTYSPFADHDSFGGVNPADVAAAQAAQDAANHPAPPKTAAEQRASDDAELAKSQTVGELWDSLTKDRPRPSAPAAPVDPASIKFAAKGNAPGQSAGAASTPDINWGGIGGTVTVPAHEQALVTASRQAALTGAIDSEAKAVDAEGAAIGEQKQAVAGSAEANAEIKRQEASGLRDIAKANKDAGVDAKLRAQNRKDDSDAYLKHIDDFAAKVASDKIDPNGMWNNASTGQKITWTIAKAFGAIGQAFLHTPTNQVADQIEAMAAQDVAAQRANHEIGREQLATMTNMYGHALQASASKEEAERVATGYALEAAKHNAQALIQNATGAAQKAKGAELIGELSQRQAALGGKKAQVEERKAETEIRLNPLVQARTVSTGPDMKDVYKTARQYVDEQAKLGTVVPPDDAIRWAYKMHTGRDPLRNAGAYVGGAKSEPNSKEEKVKEARTTVEGGIGTIDRALESGAPYKQGTIGDLWSKVPGADQSKIDALARDKYNAQVKALVGAAWRMTTDGVEPKNPNLIEEQAAHFEIHPGESEAVSRERMLALQQALRDAGTGKGVISEASQSGKVVPPTFQK